jgi:hypothetical protein
MLNVSEWWVSSRYRNQEPFYQYSTALPLRQPALLSSPCVIQRLRELIKLCSMALLTPDVTNTETVHARISSSSPLPTLQ